VLCCILGEISTTNRKLRSPNKNYRNNINLQHHFCWFSELVSWKVALFINLWREVINNMDAFIFVAVISFSNRKIRITIDKLKYLNSENIAWWKRKWTQNGYVNGLQHPSIRRWSETTWTEKQNWHSGVTLLYHLLTFRLRRLHLGPSVTMSLPSCCQR
jgi:hypothetical protein